MDKQYHLTNLLDAVKNLCKYPVEDWSIKGTYLEECPLESRATLVGAIELLINATPKEMGGFELVFRKHPAATLHFEVKNGWKNKQ